MQTGPKRCARIVIEPRHAIGLIVQRVIRRVVGHVHIDTIEILPVSLCPIDF